MTDKTYTLTIAKVCESTNTNRVTIYRWMNAGLFPKPLKLIPGRNGTVRWSQQDLDAWHAGTWCAPVAVVAE